MNPKSHTFQLAAMLSSLVLAAGCGSSLTDSDSHEAPASSALAGLTTLAPPAVGGSGSADSAGIQPSSAFLLADGGGFLVREVVSSTQPLIPDLGFEALVLEQPGDARVVMTIGEAESPLAPSSVVAEPDDGRAEGHAAIGRTVIDLVAVAVDAAAGPSERASIARSAAEGIVAQVMGEVSVYDDPNSVPDSVSTLPGWSVVDRTSFHSSTNVERIAVLYGDDRGTSLRLSWMPAPASLTLEVATAPGLVEMRTLGQREFAVSSGLSGDLSTVTWLESGYLVSLTGSLTPDEAFRTAAAVVAADPAELANASAELGRTLGSLPAEARLELDQGVAPGAVELKHWGGQQVFCHHVHAESDCTVASILQTASWFRIGDSVVIVGGFPTASDPVSVELDGAPVRLHEDGAYTWFVAKAGGTESFELSLTVGGVGPVKQTVYPSQTLLD